MTTNSDLSDQHLAGVLGPLTSRKRDRISAAGEILDGLRDLRIEAAAR